MHDIELQKYLESSDEPDLPVSRFYRIKPPGWDTLDIIAMTDYIILLAHEHSVPVYVLVEKEIIPVANSMLFDTEKPLLLHLSNRLGNVIGINGSANSPKWALALESLTMQLGMRKLTASSFMGMIPNIGLFARSKRWCDECYEVAHSHGEPVYDRLIWKFAPVIVCSHHQRYLCDRCPFPDCQKVISHLPRQVIPGFCPHCNRWLGRSSTDLFTSETNVFNETEWLERKKVNTQIFELLQATFDTPDRFGEGAIFQSLQRIIEGVFEGNRSALNRLLGISNYHKSKSPSLPLIISLGKILNLSLVQLYSGDFNTADIDYTQTITISVRIPESELEAALQTELNRETDNPESIARIAQRMGWSYTNLRKAFPLLASQIQDRWKANVRSQLEAALLLDTPVSVNSIATDISCNRGRLRQLFPKLCAAVSERYSMWMESQKDFNKTTLENALEASDPESVSSIAKRLDIKPSDLDGQHPELYKQAKARYAKFRKTQSSKDKALNCELVKKTVRSMHENGSPLPAITKVFSELPSNIDARKPEYLRAYKEAIEELKKSGSEDAAK